MSWSSSLAKFLNYLREGKKYKWYKSTPCLLIASLPSTVFQVASNLYLTLSSTLISGLLHIRDYTRALTIIIISEILILLSSIPIFSALPLLVLLLFFTRALKMKDSEPSWIFVFWDYFIYMSFVLAVGHTIKVPWTIKLDSCCLLFNSICRTKSHNALKPKEKDLQRIVLIKIEVVLYRLDLS